MALFNKNPNGATKTPLSIFNTARSNLLLVVAFSAINVILRLVSADTYFLFSASAPLALLDIAVIIDIPAVTAVAAVLAFVVIGLYLLCWALSKKHRGWLVVALVLFVLDTLVLLALYDVVAMIIDLLIHVWVLYYLITGTVAVSKMKNMSPEELAAMEAASLTPASADEAPAQELPAEPGEVIASPVEESEIPVQAPVMVNGQPVTEE